MKLNDVFTRCVVSAGPAETIAMVAGKMQEHNVGTVVIVEKRRPVGIVTDRDLALALGTNGVEPKAPVREVMTRHVLAISEDMAIYAATQMMKERQVRRLPIVDRQDQLVGMVTLDDLLRFLGRELSNLAQGIEPEMQIK